MRTNLRPILVLAAVVVLVGLVPLTTSAAQQKATNASAQTPKAAATSHGHEIKGTIASVDETAKIFAVKEQSGKELSFAWTTATHLNGTLKVGEAVTVRYMIKNGKDVATSVMLGTSAQPSKPAAQSKPSTSTIK